MKSAVGFLPDLSQRSGQRLPELPCGHTERDLNAGGGRDLLDVVELVDERDGGFLAGLHGGRAG